VVRSEPRICIRVYKQEKTWAAHGPGLWLSLDEHGTTAAWPKAYLFLVAFLRYAYDNTMVVRP